ncbi:unnamed protein product [Diatraea saccharalis]|uniref:Uncharacterized protein n=1 Tax=Diatraea saccharalis TaxID=40085 RepID=A0A9N9W885_9NEOP|nr:unnamed protein product [Diatraea saccharalis]
MQTTLPSPFNLIPTASGMSSVVEWLRAKLSRTQGVRARWSLSYCCYMERDIESSVRNDYSALMCVLVQRYFKEKQATIMKNSGVEVELENLRRELAVCKYITEKHLTVAQPD